MRNVVKGGVWKNTEDEILKAAVMKYGKNQWARISSLLVRKSAKQCKARWYEWLDPNIKKIEWSREEEEKLLHLVKIMPNQWRTIAPAVGRTAAQCLEHYEKLLDKAQGKEEGDDEARKLRPGEIDPMPESKPAKPDPVDMDEDEKEMLQEARARLANTKGKKAKRKAREKQLDEARRLASLQKRREMKAAGMDVGRRKAKIRGIDYNKEIPLEHRPAPGFFDPSEELQREKMEKEFRPPALSSGADGPKRSQIEERNRRDDQKKMDDKKKANLPAALAQLARMNEPEQIRKKSKMALPEPQLSDRDLEEIAKISTAPEQPVEEGGEGGKKPTQMLLSRYDATPALHTASGAASVGATPLRNMLPPPQASRTPARPDMLLQEAQNLAAMAAAQTPLVGGANPSMSADFGGITPARAPISTPSALARATPRVRAAAAAVGNLSGMHTPLRDELRLNDERSVTAEDSREEERQRQQAIRKQVQEGLFKLPAPKNEYQIVVPAAEKETEDDETKTPSEVIPDASDVLAEEAAKARAAQAELLRERTSVLRRALPRPLTVESSLLSAPRADASELSVAEALVRKEMHTIILHDAVHYPVGKAVKLPAGATFERFTSDQIRAAEAMIKAELDSMVPTLPPMSAVLAAWEAVTDRTIVTPGTGALAEQGEARLDAVRKQFESVKLHVTREGKKAQNLEKKIALLHGGYENVARATAKDVSDAVAHLAEAETELACFKALRAQEVLTAPARVAALKDEVAALKSRENELQGRYAELAARLQSLQAAK